MLKEFMLGISWLACLGCVSNDHETAPQQTTDTITIVFNHVPKYAKKIEVAKNIFVENTDPLILIYNNFHANFYEPDSAKSSDTLKIVPSSDYVFIKHSFNTISFFNYLFKKGDLVVFSYENNVPVANVLNRNVKKYDINTELNERKRTESATYPYTPYEIYLNPFFADNKTDQDNIVNLFRKVKEKKYYQAKVYFFNELKFLDSVNNKGEISADYYNLYSDKCRYLTAMMDAEQNSVSIDSLLAIKPQVDLRLPYSFYYDFISSFVQYKIEKGTKTLFSSNGQIADYRKVFDTIKRSQFITSPYKDLILHKYLALIANNFGAKDFEKYFSWFQKSSKDSFLVADIKTRYFANFQKFKYSLDTLYVGNNKKGVFNFADILNKNKGRIIYIDFWASWCMPCRAVMKESQLLRNEYKGIVFIYLSIDSDFDLWDKAIRNERLDVYDKSYLILNNQTNRFLREIKLTSIPRYILFDKEGKLINQNAPGPETKEVRELFTE